MRLVAGLSILSALALSCGGGQPVASPQERSVPVKIRYSAFKPKNLTIPAGTTVRFVIQNTDPIDHEFIIGPSEVHERHENGTEQSHGEVPGEVSIPADSTAETTYTFSKEGRILFACHLPGHLDYGMKGWVEVT